MVDRPYYEGGEMSEIKGKRIRAAYEVFQKHKKKMKPDDAFYLAVDQILGEAEKRSSRKQHKMLQDQEDDFTRWEQEKKALKNRITDLEEQIKDIHDTITNSLKSDEKGRLYLTWTKRDFKKARKRSKELMEWLGEGDEHQHEV